MASRRTRQRDQSSKCLVLLSETESNVVTYLSDDYIRLLHMSLDLARLCVRLYMLLLSLRMTSITDHFVCFIPLKWTFLSLHVLLYKGLLAFV